MLRHFLAFVAFFLFEQKHFICFRTMNTNGWLRRSSPLFLRSGGPQFTSEGYLRGPAPGKVITVESVTSLLILPTEYAL